MHPGHIEYFELSKALGDELRVIVNNDRQAELKRGKKSFQDQQFRMRVVGAMKPVDKVVLSIDMDQRNTGEIPVVHSLEKVALMIREQDPDAHIVFANGGDRNKNLDNIPEADVCRKYDIDLVDGMWEKIHSSRDYVVLD